MVMRWMRTLVVTGVAITLFIFVVSILLFMASLIWVPQQPTATTITVEPINPFTVMPAAVTAATPTTPVASSQDYVARIPPDVQRTAELETISRALQSYRHASGDNSYPKVLSTLVKTSYLAVQPPASYSYYLDSSGTFYSVCDLADQTYECVTSDLGSEDPITFAAPALDDSSPTQWHRIVWNDSTSTTLQLTYPPLWTYQSGSATIELDATDVDGKAVPVARIVLTNYQPRAGETFSQFQKDNLAQSGNEVSTIRQTTVSGYPAYESLIQEPRATSQVLSGASLLIDPGNGHIYRLDFLTDRTLSPLTASILADIINSVAVSTGGASH